MFKLHDVNNKFPRATYHTMVPSTEELNCLIREGVLGVQYFHGRTSAFWLIIIKKRKDSRLRTVNQRVSD